jgi:hypothetical protein
MSHSTVLLRKWKLRLLELYTEAPSPDRQPRWATSGWPLLEPSDTAPQRKTVHLQLATRSAFSRQLLFSFSCVVATAAGSSVAAGGFAAAVVWFVFEPFVLGYLYLYLYLYLNWKLDNKDGPANDGKVGQASKDSFRCWSMYQGFFDLLVLVVPSNCVGDPGRQNEPAKLVVTGKMR